MTHLAVDAHAQGDTRRRNLGALLRRVHLGGAASRVELADWLGVNRSTVMALTADLAAAGLVREVPATTSGRAGRPSFVVRPESEAVHVLAFDIAVDRLVAARVDLGGTVSARLEATRPRVGADLDAVVSVLADFGRALHHNAPPTSVCVGIGASYCGMIRPGDGMVRFGRTWGGWTRRSASNWPADWISACRCWSVTRLTWARWPSINAVPASARRT